MSDEPAILYLEADDEVTSVVRRIRGASEPRVIIVAPGRSRAVSSVVAIRLLARAASDADRTLAVVGDALTRSLAAEAGVEAYGTLDDARGAVRDAEGMVARRATITVVRGVASDETAPTLAAGPSATTESRVDAVGAPAQAPRDEEPTRAHPVPGAPPSVPSHAPRSDRRPAAAGVTRGALATAVALLALAAVGAAVVLPAATITIRPTAVPVGPATYSIVDAPAERRSGTVEATATVTASGTYTDQAPAAGSVVLFNWTASPVRVPAGTFVAAGEQAFATQADVVVPGGSLTADGRIAAGDIAVAVVAAAAGPDGNVAAEAIDTVVNGSIDAQLRGFPNNPERRVTNPEPMAGGVDATGPEIVQADVDAAVALLREQLAAAVAEALPDGDVVALPPNAPDPTIQGLEALVGTRDEPTAELAGRQDWEAWIVDAAAVEAEAVERFAGDATILPEGHELLAEGTDLAVAGTTVDGDRVTVEVRVGGLAAPVVDRAAAVEAARGRSAGDAESALARFGEVEVGLWPFWTSEVPSLDWRISVDVVGPSESLPPSPGPSDAGTGPPP